MRCGRCAVAAVVVILLAVLITTGMTGHGGAKGAVTGLLVDRGVIGEVQEDGTVHVSQDDLPENESYMITDENGDVCVGNCLDTRTTGGDTH